MSHIRITPADISLFARVITLRAITVVALAGLIFYVLVTLAGGLPVVGALIGVAIYMAVLGLIVYVRSKQRMRKMWEVQAPGGEMDVELTGKEWKMTTEASSGSSNWQVFTKRYELLGCYILRLAGGAVAVYRKDYFSDKERQLIESKIPKARTWLR
jgi:hypothetical protein